MDKLPQPLRQPDISRLLSRASQLRAHKPAIAYWCDYAAMVRIMTAGLHLADDECRQYTEDLMGRLEGVKAAFGGGMDGDDEELEEGENDDGIAIRNNDVGKRVVEQFAQETFARAERAMRADKATR